MCQTIAMTLFWGPKEGLPPNWAGRGHLAPTDSPRCFTSHPGEEVSLPLAVVALYGCKIAQTEGLETAEIYYLTAWRPEVQRQGVGRARPPLKPAGEDPSLAPAVAGTAPPGPCLCVTWPSSPTGFPSCCTDISHAGCKAHPTPAWLCSN